MVCNGKTKQHRQIRCSGIPGFSTCRSRDLPVPCMPAAWIVNNKNGRNCWTATNFYASDQTDKTAIESVEKSLTEWFILYTGLFLDRPTQLFFKYSYID